MKKIVAALTALICVMGSLAFVPVTDTNTNVPVTNLVACAADTDNFVVQPGKNAGKYTNPYIDTQIYTYTLNEVTSNLEKDIDSKDAATADSAEALSDNLSTKYKKASYSLGVYSVEISHQEINDKNKEVKVVDSLEYHIAITGIKDTALDVNVADFTVDSSTIAAMNDYVSAVEGKKATQAAYKDVIKLEITDTKPTVLASVNTAYLKSIDMTGIQYINKGVFSNAKYITEITIPKSVVFIGEGAFKGSGLKKLTVNCQLPYIPDSLCESTALTDFKLADYSLVRAIGKSSFKDTPLGATMFDGIEKATNHEDRFVVNDSAYENCTNLTSVVMPSNLYLLEPAAFKGCTKLKSVTFGKTTIGADKECFMNCTSLTDITFNDVLFALGGGCFQGCTSLKTVSGIPETIFDWVDYDANSGVGFGNAMFSGCTSLVSCELPASLTIVPEQCFLGCTSLKTVDIISKKKKLTIKENIVEIGEQAFEGCSKILEINYPNVTLIGKAAFKGCSAMTSFSVGECEATTKTDYAGKKTDYPGVGSNALEGCSSLTSITLKSDSYGELPNVKTNSSDGYVFKDCTGVKTITISGDWMEKVPQGTFSGCTALETIKGNLKNVTIVGKNAFATCSKLKKVDFENVVIVEEGAFSDCTSLTSISTTAKAISAQDYGAKCFYNCSSLQIPVDGSISTIGANAFQKSGITSVDIAGMTGGTVVIGNAAFSECENLKSLKIASEDVKEFSVGNQIAAKCPNLETVIYQGPTITQGMFSTCEKLKTVKTDATSIKAKAFENCTSLTGLLTMDGKKSMIATDIDDSAFLNCSSLEKIPADKDTTYNGTKQYMGCTALTAVETGVLTDSMFSGCTSLAKVTAEGINEIPAGCFANCTSLTSYDFSKMINYSIGKSAFAGSGLTKLKMEGAQKIADSAFANCEALAEADVDAVTIGTSAFQNCIGLTKLELYTETIGANAFSGCTDLESVNIVNSDSRKLTTVGANAFVNCSNLFAIPIPGNPTIAGKAVGYVNGKAVEDFIIYGVPGSSSETYANSNDKFRFVNIDSYDPSKVQRHTLGDVDGNNILSVVDVVMLQKWIHGDKTQDLFGSNMDVTGDGVVDIFDLSALKKKLLTK